MAFTFFSEYYSKSPATFVVSVLVMLFSVTALVNKKLFFACILHPVSVVRDRQYYRIFTADLVNADVLHLMLNEFVLYVFCSDLEETLRKSGGSGSLQFLVIYFCSLLFAAGIVIVRHYKDFNYSTTGTSGSIMGCMFGFMLLDPNYIVYNFTEGGGIKNIYGGLMYILLLFAYQRKKGGGLINHEYHFYGALGGLITTLTLHPEIFHGVRG
ncbi:MAG: rhomboid family intramembrane serine protease [Bacteroidetes bacterium]|nr:rhomboid family intramembrane serine protease [Bacteroidota bacterium]